MDIYNLEYSILDKLGRQKIVRHGGIFKTDDAIQRAKERIINENAGKKLLFQIYLINDPFLKVR